MHHIKFQIIHMKSCQQNVKLMTDLIQKFNCLETVFMTLFWTNILQRVNITSKKLQSV